MEKDEIIVPRRHHFSFTTFSYDTKRLIPFYYTPTGSTSRDVVMKDASYFDDILPIELIRMIFSYIDDVHTFGRAVQVNKLWYEEVHVAWKNFCCSR